MARGFAGWGNDLYTGRRSYQIVARRRLWYTIALVLVVLSLGLIVKPGLNPGIEFRGGSELVVSDVADPSQDLAIRTVQSVAPEESPRVTNLGTSALRIQTSELTNDQVAEVVLRLAEAFEVPEEQISTSFIGPTWGADVSRQALIGVGVFLLLVTLVMVVYFRNWRMAVAGLIALFHDAIVTVGVYAAVGWEVTPATVIGFLTILAYSVYDGVVVFDKVRENTADTLLQARYTYAEKANLAVNQTLVRSINTSVIALLPVASILVIGAFLLNAGTLRDIALALFVGMFVGTLSSIFLAPPLEVTLREMQADIKAHTRKILAGRTQTDEEGQTTVAEVAVGQLMPGSHQGHSAQPRRKKR
ncbi:MAG: protein translocase subunit SecF [Micrococcales bacterium]|nr:protein translocase subunit SecF [Micrococcales bacterium]